MDNPITVKSSSWNSLLTACENWLHGSPLHPAAWQGFGIPAVDVSEDDKEVTVKVEVPGIGPKDIEVTHEDGVLYLKGEKRGQQEEAKKNYAFRESWSGSFSRALPLGNGIDWSKSDARFRDGVLTVTIPKIPGASDRKKIDIH